MLLASRTAGEVEGAAGEIAAAGATARAHVAHVTDAAHVDAAHVEAMVAAALELGDLRVCVNSAGTTQAGCRGRRRS